jgi:hypothetical protein
MILGPPLLDLRCRDAAQRACNCFGMLTESAGRRLKFRQLADTAALSGSG